MTPKQHKKIDRVLKMFPFAKWRISERPALPEYLILHLEFTSLNLKITIKIDKKGEVIEDN